MQDQGFVGVRFDDVGVSDFLERRIEHAVIGVAIDIVDFGDGVEAVGWEFRCIGALCGGKSGCFGVLE